VWLSQAVIQRTHPSTITSHRQSLKSKKSKSKDLSALEVRFHDDELYKSMFTFTLPGTWYSAT